MENAVDNVKMSNEDSLPLLKTVDQKDGKLSKPENSKVEDLLTNSDKSAQKSPNVKTKLRNRQNLENKDRGASLKRKNDETSPKSDVRGRSPKCVNKEKVSKEKVTKLRKKFEDEANNLQSQSKILGLFKKSNALKQSEESKSPKTKDKSSTEGVERLNENETVHGNTSKSDEPKNNNSALNADYENNYRSDGIRAREAEMNRKKKLMENKGLLKDEDPKKAKVNRNTVILRSATKRIHRYILNKPKSDNIPSVLGHYPVLISTTFIILFVFLAQLILNKVSFNGRCVTKVLYPSSAMNKKPYHVIFGYGACEYNLQQKSETIGFLGSKANDKGWPPELVSDETVVESSASFDAPNNRVFNLFGSLDANYIRNYNESFRLFWSMLMHKGLIHLLFNLVAQSQILWIIEPDWGFFRTATTFFLSGLVGNLAAAVFEPSFNVLGSSGCLFGLIASLIPYCIENWTLLASPIYILVFTLVITVISLSAFNSTVSIYSHFGGWIGGLLWGFATLRSSFNLTDCAIKESVLLSPLFRSKLTPEAKSKIRHSYQVKQITCVNKIRVQNRDKSFSKRMMKVFMYPVEYFKRGPYDILMRIIPLILLVVIVVMLFCYLYIESLYSKMFPLNEHSKLSQCCYLFTKGEAGFTKKVFWCFESYQSAQALCNIKPQPSDL